MRTHFYLDPTQKIQLCGLYLLQLSEEGETEFCLPLPAEQTFLSPVFHWLQEKQYLQVLNEYYRITSKGQDVLKHFRSRYQRFLEEMDVYCAVDLENGEFAFSYYDAFPTRAEWEVFLAQERWEDVRVALSEWQGKDPIEVVFMDFVQRGEYGLPRWGWDYEGFLGSVWDEIALTAQSTIRLRDLAYEDEGLFFPAEQVAKDIYLQGQEIMISRSGCDLNTM